ncbi:MAG: hypothetical protein ACOYOO_09755 [Saprospiraceae bacterium]|jgi:hypothetical protein
MLLIADSGSTKADWVLSDGKGGLRAFSTLGFNPLYHSESFIAETCREVFDAGEMSCPQVSWPSDVSCSFYRLGSFPLQGYPDAYPGGALHTPWAFYPETD